MFNISVHYFNLNFLISVPYSETIQYHFNHIHYPHHLSLIPKSEYNLFHLFAISEPKFYVRCAKAEPNHSHFCALPDPITTVSVPRLSHM